MPKTPSEQQKYLQELKELECSCGGVFACTTPERHKKRWEQKVSNLQQHIAAAETPEEKERYRQKLTKLNQAEHKKAYLIAEVYSLEAVSKEM